MIINTKLFGDLKVDKKNGVYEEVTAVFNKQNNTFSISIDEELIQNSQNAQDTKKLLDNLEKLDGSARAMIQDSFESSEKIVQYYMQFHLDELEDCCPGVWAELFPTVPQSLIDEQFLINNLKLDTVWFYEDEKGINVVLDYVISKDYSDEVLAVSFDSDINFISLAHES